MVVGESPWSNKEALEEVNALTSSNRPSVLKHDESPPGLTRLGPVANLGLIHMMKTFDWDSLYLTQVRSVAVPQYVPCASWVLVFDCSCSHSDDRSIGIGG